MPLPLINVLGSAALTAATPFLSKALQGLMGGSEAERERERALAETERVAQGGTTQGQAGMAYARSRALQDLAQQAQRGTAQQQAGLARDAMTAGADVQARYASQLAELRSREQERARETAAYLRNQKAREDALIARQTASKFAEGALTPLVQQLVTPGASSAGLTPEEAAAYNEANTRGSAASGDLGAAFEQRTRELATGSAAPVVAPVAGGVTSAGAASALGFEPGARVGGMSQTTYQQRTGMPGVTDQERALNPSQQVADLQAQRTLATANIAPGPVAPGAMVDYTKGMGGGGDFATLADRQAATSAMSPFMKSPAEQGAAASLAPTKTPMAFSYEGEQVEGLRKTRPGRMPRKPGQTVRGGGGIAL